MDETCKGWSEPKLRDETNIHKAANDEELATFFAKLQTEEDEKEWQEQTQEGRQRGKRRKAPRISSMVKVRLCPPNEDRSMEHKRITLSSEPK